MTDAPEIKVQNVTKVVYSDVIKGRQTIIRDLSVDFASGRSSALLGHNGAGKTTTIKLILGLVRPTTGHVTIDGHAVGEAQRRLIGYMPEVNRIPLVLTPVEVLNFHLACYRPAKLKDAKSRKEAIEAALQRVELWDHRNKRVGKLSKGMARRLAWAQATIHDPSVLILDEPMSGLDPTGRMAMHHWISEFRAASKTIVFCSHEMNTVAELCDDVSILRKGQLVYSSGHSGVSGAAGGYRLSLSGVDENALRVLRETGLRNGSRLPQWVRMQHEGFLARLDFAGYADASQWVMAALQQGVVVTDFGAAPLIDESTLLKYFGKDLEV